VLVSHDVEEAMVLADRVVLFIDGRLDDDFGPFAAPASPWRRALRRAHRGLARSAAARRAEPLNARFCQRVEGGFTCEVNDQIDDPEPPVHRSAT
jgi:hypothetical protein